MPHERREWAIRTDRQPGRRRETGRQTTYGGNDVANNGGRRREEGKRGRVIQIRRQAGGIIISLPL